MSSRPRYSTLIPALDHLAPARFLSLKIAVEFVRRARHHDQALVDAEPLERLGLRRCYGRLVEAVDCFGRYLGRRDRPISLSPNGAFNEGNADEIANKLSSNIAKLEVRVFDEKK
jgi:hypothetical protein